MRASCLIPLVLAGGLAVAACGETEEAPASTAPAETTASPTAPTPTLADLPAPYNDADLANGKTVFAKCKNCHYLVARQGNKVGPNLHGVFERPKASAPKFKYSSALLAFKEERWTPELVDRWLSNPGTFVPGNGMFFNGVGKPDDRRDVIAYLLIETQQ